MNSAPPDSRFRGHTGHYWGRALIKSARNSRADRLPDRLQKGPYPGVETPDQPDEADVLDAGDVVGGFGVVGLASTASGWVVVYREERQYLTGGI